MNEFVIHKSLNSRRKEFIDLCEVATQCHKDRTPYKQAIFKMCKTVEADFFRCDRDEVDGVPYVTAYFCFPTSLPMRIQAMSSPTVQILYPFLRRYSGGMSMARLVLPQAEGKAAAI